MDKLVVINSGEDEIKIDGRELHMFLEIETPYNKWFSRMCEYGFSEGTDFWTNLSESTGGRPATVHELTLDMAKEIAMLQRNEKGKQARQYFIQLEKDWNSPEKVMARALQISNRKIAEKTKDIELLCEKIEADKPKVIFADAVSASHTSILVGEMAKLLRQNGIDIGQQRLFRWLRENGYLMKSGSSKNMPTQRSMDMGLFTIKEGSYVDSN
uniref:phage antirepressor KilAC domain-containing protein n=1 Tax=uncultured Anaerovibrio sp. TaxID=361586 RepID=UPI0026036BC6